ncbi:MAG: class I SAM-dependent methyltransferase [Saprospiraceae bacterium]
MQNKNTSYHPESYWSEVAQRIDSRGERNVIAGDDEPYYHYKRQRFLELLNGLAFDGKSVLELGSGPGGNLHEIHKHQPARLVGADISANMIQLARKNLGVKNDIELVKIDGERLPFADQEFDLAFTATVLQHNTDEAMMQKILFELCRVTARELVLFEQINQTISGDELMKGRPVAYYEQLCNEKGFILKDVEFININISYYVCGAIRKGLNPAKRKEGEPLSGISLFLENTLLPVTKRLDRVFKAEKDLARLIFHRKA